MANQTVILHTGAISDLYFSSEAFDDYSPEHESYAPPPLQMPDPRDWEIVEAIAYDGVGIEGFSNEDIYRVSQRIMITDEQYDQLVREGKIKPEDLDYLMVPTPRLEQGRIDSEANFLEELG